MPLPTELPCQTQDLLSYSHLFYVYVCPHVHMHITCMSGAHGGQKSELDILEPEFDKVMNLLVGAEHQN